MTIAAPQQDRLAAEESARGIRPAQDHCIFECGQQVFAIDLGAVREVLSGKLATPVPQAPPALVGVVDLHGDVLPVVQLCLLLDMPARPYTPANPILVLCSNETKIGVVVDRVRHVRPIDSASVTPATHDLYRGWASATTPAAAVLHVDALVTHALRTVAARLHNATTNHSARMDTGSVASN